MCSAATTRQTQTRCALYRNVEVNLTLSFPQSMSQETDSVRSSWNGGVQSS